ncbi:two-component regulator propeller domain-containing protein [Niabella aurantiaca]|uniref:two-component regulator propeller domain-containing protein n=1 Tax=Niabella aurantiaca TaxID=379900 RepID=UPI000360FB62|nr:two-component regulator propeller domain-containing protein [Niabella aurantiaca]
MTVDKKIYVFYLELLLLLFFCKTGTAQNNFRHFSTISVDKGLSQSTVWTITQDHLGFIWLGTRDGLNRYDGRSFTVYRPAKDHQKQISSYYIRYLFTDKKGTLWIGGNGGINSYNYLTNTFESFNITPGPGEWFISSIIQDAEGRIWAASNAGELYGSDASGKKFIKVATSALSDIKEIYSLSLWGGDILMGSDQGLFLYHPGSNKVAPVLAAAVNTRVNCLFRDGDDIWAGTEGDGLLQLNTASGSFKKYVHQAGDPSSIANNNVRSIAKDEEGVLWIGTFTGLTIMNGPDLFQNYYHDPKNEFSIGQNSVRAIYRDRQNGMWLGTYYGGVSYFHSQGVTFNSLNQNSEQAALNDNVVNVIRQDGDGNFWIGTEGGGLNYWVPGENKIRYFISRENAPGLSSNNIKSIEFTDDGTLLVGTHNKGLNIFNPATGANKNLRYNAADPKGIAGDMVYALLKDHAGRIFVGTRTGLNLFDRATETFTLVGKDSRGKSISSPGITYLMEDRKKRVWIGTINGVNILDAGKMIFEQLDNHSLSNAIINFIYEDGRGRVWVGTRDGLNLYDENKKSFVSYKEKEGLLGGNINSILSDNEGNLWITTNTSLVKYNPDKNQSVHFDSKDGLQNNQFNIYASCKAHDGRLFFGGLNGITYFSPQMFNQKPLSLQIAFTGLEVFGQLVTPNDSTGILKKYINDVESLKLPNEYRQFTILFNTFNYISDSRTRYMYRLDGFDRSWQQAEGLPRASYTNLQPGSYTFHVKALGSQGEESPERTLLIIIRPVWYRTNWFYALVVVFIVAAAIFLYRILTERMRALHQLKLERVNREKVNYINKIKLDFFTNVSHELRTPLTLIMAPLEEILKQPDPDKKRHQRHELMMRNTRRLYNIVNQLFEFRKTEMGTRRLRVANNDMPRFLQDIYQSFKSLAEKNHIDYQNQSATGRLQFLFDKDAVENMVFNLLSNAFKYTPDGGTVVLRLDANATYAIISVSDTGKGIEKEQLHKIFDRFYQVNGEEMNLGSGIGLAFTSRLAELHHGYIDVKSEPGKGSRFTIYLPLNDAAYGEDRRVDDMDLSAGNGLETEAVPQANPGGELPVVAPANEESILIVDDNREIVEYIRGYFISDYAVAVAYNGKEALGKIEEQQPDLIISDVMMPEMDGLNFCRRVKQNIQTSHIPLLLVTAKTETAHQLKGLDMGADDYITKPFSISLLAAKVQAILRLRKRLRAYYADVKEVEPEKLTFNKIDQEFLEKAVSIIEDNLDAYDFSVEKLSRELGMSRSNLYLKVKAITGDSATALIKRVRLKKAAELIRLQKYAVSEIAYMCGFNTPSYFSTAFKQFYGCMPTEYLEKPDPGTAS